MFATEVEETARAPRDGWGARVVSVQVAHFCWTNRRTTAGDVPATFTAVIWT